MTVYELIQELAKFPANAEVEPWTEGARKKRRIWSVNQAIPTRREGEDPINREDYPVLIRIDIDPLAKEDKPRNPTMR